MSWFSSPVLRMMNSLTAITPESMQRLRGQTVRGQHRAEAWCTSLMTQLAGHCVSVTRTMYSLNAFLSTSQAPCNMSWRTKMHV